MLNWMKLEFRRQLEYKKIKNMLRLQVICCIKMFLMSLLLLKWVAPTYLSLKQYNTSYNILQILKHFISGQKYLHVRIHLVLDGGL